MRIKILFLPLIFFSSTFSVLALEVVQTFPARNNIGASLNTAIRIKFDSVIRSNTVNQNSFRILGQMSGKKEGIYYVLGNDIIFQTNTPFEVGERVLVILTKSIKSFIGDSLPSGYQFEFYVKTLGGSANFYPSIQSPIFDYNVPYYIYGGDLDGDNNCDIASMNEGVPYQMAVFLNKNGKGIFGSPSNYPTGQEASNCWGADLDYDGDIDILTTETGEEKVAILKNRGDGTFEPQVQHTTTPGKPHGTVAGDFDGDGDLDFAVCNLTSHILTGVSSLQIFENPGDGVFQTPPHSHIGEVNEPRSLFGGDLDNDGDFDLAVVNEGWGDISIFRNDGRGNFTTDTSRTFVGVRPWNIYGGDLDKDGDIDLVTVQRDGTLTVSFNNGSGYFSHSSKDVYTFNGSGIGVYVADLDGDNDLDLISSNYIGATISVYINDGSANFTIRRDFNLTSAGSYAWAHDLDGDGDLDISVVDEIADHLYIFFNADSPCIAFSGDANADNQVLLSDIVYIVDHLFRGGQKPFPLCSGDADGDGRVRLSDVIILVNFLFKSSSPPIKSGVCCL